MKTCLLYFKTLFFTLLLCGTVLSVLKAQFINGQNAAAVLGQSTFNTSNTGISSTGFNFPSGVAIDPTNGKLFVSDYLNNRVLRYANAASFANGAAAEVVLGQSSFATNVPATTQTGMKTPIGVAVDAAGNLYVADYGNNRVLRFNIAATKANGASADGVLGQAMFTTNIAANTQSGLGIPIGVAVSPAGNLYVAEVGNNRVVRFNAAATKANGASADGVLGQPTFTTNTQGTTQSGINQPYAVAVDITENLYVADFNNHRVLRFNAAANKTNGANADGVLGQPNFTSKTIASTQSGMYNPRGVAVDVDGNLYVADGYNNRVLRFNGAASKANGANADGVLGQTTFTMNTQSTTQAGMNLPFGLAIDAAKNLYVADQVNHRVLRFDALQLPPSLTDFTPTQGPIGTVVTINGSNLQSPQSVVIGGVQALLISATSNKIVAMVMPGASTGGVSITTSLGSNPTFGSFRVITPTPYPTIQQGSKLVSSNVTGAALQGEVVAISADGNTAVVGARNDNTNVGGIPTSGSVSVYVKVSGSWSEQAELLPNDAAVVPSLNSSTPSFGSSVSISADGNTVLVGGYSDGFSRGAAWVFVRNGVNWAQQGSKLVDLTSTSLSVQGSSVSLSADGNTALVGAPNDGTYGSAIIYTRSGNLWAQFGNKLIPNDATSGGGFGSGVLSADGNTALIGGGDNNFAGAAWVFIRTASGFVQQGGKLVGSGAIGNAQQGASALSADGNTALIRGHFDNQGVGATWVFTRVGNVWGQQAKLIISGTSGYANQGGGNQNGGVLSADGNTALISAYADNNLNGGVWVFTRTSGSWSQKNKLYGNGVVGTPAQQGSGLSMTADGNTCIIGGNRDNFYTGASWIFVSKSPVINEFTPTSVCANNQVTITGVNLDSVTAVTFGGVSAVGPFTSSGGGTQVIVTVPSGAVSGNILLTTTGGTTVSNSSFTVNAGVNMPGTITGLGSINACMVASSTYTIAAVPGATSYTWEETSSLGDYNEDVTTTPSYTVGFTELFYSVNLRVRANNGACVSGYSPTRIINVRGCGTRVDANLELADEEQQTGIYPNPANAVLNIVLEAPVAKLEATLTDLYGNLVKSVVQKDAKAVNINTSDVNVGIYVLTLVVDGKRTTQRI